MSKHQSYHPQIQNWVWQYSLTPWGIFSSAPWLRGLARSFGVGASDAPNPPPLGWLIALMRGRPVNQPADIVGFTWPPLPRPDCDPTVPQPDLSGKLRYARNLALASSYSRNERRCFGNLGTTLEQYQNSIRIVLEANLLSAFRTFGVIWVELCQLSVLTVLRAWWTLKEMALLMLVWKL